MIGTTISDFVSMLHARYRGSAFTSSTMIVAFSVAAAPQMPRPSGMRVCGEGLPRKARARARGRRADRCPPTCSAGTSAVRSRTFFGSDRARLESARFAFLMGGVRISYQDQQFGRVDLNPSIRGTAETTRQESALVAIEALTCACNRPNADATGIAFSEARRCDPRRFPLQTRDVPDTIIPEYTVAAEHSDRDRRAVPQTGVDAGPSTPRASRAEQDHDAASVADEVKPAADLAEDCARQFPAIRHLAERDDLKDRGRRDRAEGEQSAHPEGDRQDRANRRPSILSL